MDSVVSAPSSTKSNSFFTPFPPTVGPYHKFDWFVAFSRPTSIPAISVLDANIPFLTAFITDGVLFNSAPVDRETGPSFQKGLQIERLLQL